MLEPNTPIPVSVLIVDDNPDKLTALAAALEGMDVEVVTAASGTEALRKLLEQDFAVVLLDVNMPVMDGFETARMIRSRPRSEHLPIIFITAERLDEDARVQGYELGAVDYILSPVLPQILRSKVTAFADLYRLREQVARHNWALEEQVEACTADLRESETRYRRITEGITDYQYTVRIENGCAVETTQGAACATVTGYTADEFAADPHLWIQMVAPEDRDLVRERARQILAEQDDSPIEYRIAQKNGETRWISDTAILFRDGSGKLLSYIGAVKDITERKRTEQVLKELSDRLQHILASTPAVHYACRVDGEHLVPTYASPNLKNTWGYDLKEYLGNAEWWWSNIHPEGRDGVIGAIRAAVMAAGRSHYAHEYRFRRKDGSYRWVHDELQIIRDQGDQPMEIVGSWLDITERKHLENELEESHQLLRKLAEKAEILREQERKRIAREVHDELGQTLTALRMDVALINLRFGGQNAALLEKAQGMAVLLDQADRCVRNVVSNLHPAALDMGVVPAIRWLCNEFSARTGCSCVLNTVEEHVDLDEALAVAVFRIVQELLTNAARHAKASSVNITLARHDDGIHLEVRDNGKGFDPAAVAINKSFGLLGIRERAIALGGDVGLVSAPDQGTVVAIRLPVKKKRSKK